MARKISNTRLLLLFSLAFVLFGLCFAEDYYDASVPPSPGSFIKVNTIDSSTGAFVPAILTIKIEFATDSSMNYESEVQVSQANEEISIELPPPDYKPTATITAHAEGYEDSPDTLTITGEQYTASVSGGNPKGIPVGIYKSDGAVFESDSTDVLTPEQKQIGSLLADKTFTLKRIPGAALGCVKDSDCSSSQACTSGKCVNGANPGKTTASSSGGCCGLFFILPLIVSAFILSRKNEVL